MKLPIALLTISEVAIFSLSQIDVIPEQLFSILIQLPIVGLFAWYVLHSNKQTREWLNHLLETQDKRHQRTTELFEKILDKMDKRQTEMNQQLAINTATATEILKIVDLASRFEQK